ncbi:unnamed protein product, partial [Penicillium olsonii]
RLGLVVAPSQVRLQPSAGDGYAWSVTESKKSLLQSNLGSGSVGLYRSICEELGRSLEAVTPQTLRVAHSERDHLAKEKTLSAQSDERESGSFTAKIRELEFANRELSGELDRTRMHVEDSLSEKNKMQVEILRLQDELGGVSSRASHLENELDRVTRGIREAMHVLQVHQIQGGSASEHETRPDESVESVDGVLLETPTVSMRVAS